MHAIIKCLQILLKRSYLNLMKKILQFCFCPERDSKTLLTIVLKSPMNVGNQDGEKFFLYFDSILKIEDVARKIYGLNKCKVRCKHLPYVFDSVQNECLIAMLL